LKEGEGMNKDMIGKILALGVIILFITVGIQPALAIEPKLSADNIEKEEDCDCQELDSKTLSRVNLLLTKLKLRTDLVSKRFGHIPEIKEKCDKLSDVVNSINPKGIILDICWAIYNLSFTLQDLFFNYTYLIRYHANQGNGILVFYYFFKAIGVYSIVIIAGTIAILLRCWFAP
jgi:hypothetical protein